MPNKRRCSHRQRREHRQHRVIPLLQSPSSAPCKLVGPDASAHSAQLPCANLSVPMLLHTPPDFPVQTRRSRLVCTLRSMIHNSCSFPCKLVGPDSFARSRSVDPDRPLSRLFYQVFAAFSVGGFTSSSPLPVPLRVQPPGPNTLTPIATRPQQSQGGAAKGKR